MCIVIKPDPLVTSSTDPLKGSLNVTEKQKYSETMDRRSSSSSSPHLFLMLRDNKYHYCLYRISEPENTDESTILNLGDPFLEMDNRTYSNRMSFVALGTSIYMVGGLSFSGGRCLPSNQVLICDTVSKAIVPGPNLVSGQASPVLLTLGSKIYALSSNFFRPGTPYSNREGIPQLQVLDTENPQRGWSSLPAPPVCFRGETMMCAVVAYAAVPSVVGTTSSAIFITLSNDPGTYAFDVDNEVWDHVSEVDLPFFRYAMPIPPSPDLPCAPSLYCALSSEISERFSAFRFRYNAENRKFQVDEIKIHNSSVLSRSWELPPKDLYYVQPLIAVGPFGRVYSIEVGIDDIKAVEDPTAKCYVKVNAAQVCQVKPKKMKRHIRNEEKENDDNMPSKRSRTTKVVRNNEEEDGGEFNMSKIWSSSLFAGPMGVCDDRSTVAFAL